MEQLMQMQQAMEKNGGQLPPEYLAQMQAAQSAKAAADASQPEPQNPAPADVTKAAPQPVSHEATMPQQPIQPQHAATQQHAAPVKTERPTRPVQPQPQSSPAPRAHDRAGFDIRTIVGEANDSEDGQK